VSDKVMFSRQPTLAMQAQEWHDFLADSADFL
jgi:hypothetical protein